MNYSQPLISGIQKYFAEKYDDVISEDTAEQYLSSLGELYLAFAGIEQNIKEQDGILSRK